ncbi:MAG: D-glycerate dehydrogenase [Dehalococcoidia bacterium]
MPDRPRVLVTRVLPGGDAPDSPLARLHAEAEVDVWPEDEPPSADALRAGAAEADGLLTMLTERIDGDLLDAAPGVRAVANMAVGYDNIDVAACTARRVLVTNTPGVLTDATADMAFTLLLAAARRLLEGERAVREGRWGAWHPTWLLGRDVSGSTLGVVGPGRIGHAVAERARGFGMRVLYHGRREVPDFPGERAPLETLLAESHFVSMHVPLTEETAGMCDAGFFANMRPDAVFINTTRGGVVDQPALARALRAGTIAAAGVDVTTPEPLPPEDPLLDSPRLVVAPHLGSATEQTRTKMAHLAVDGLLAALRGERPAHLVNADAFEGAAR